MSTAPNSSFQASKKWSCCLVKKALVARLGDGLLAPIRKTISSRSTESRTVRRHRPFDGVIDTFMRLDLASAMPHSIGNKGLKFQVDSSLHRVWVRQTIG